MIRFVLLASMLVGCRVDHHPSPVKQSELVDALRVRAAGWLAEIKGAQSPTGWVSDKDCDGTLWAGEGLAAGAAITLEAAEWAPGEIHRRPQVDGECYPSEASSTVSQDMLMGYLVGTYSRGEVGALERLQGYGEAHSWTMGNPFDAHEVHWSPAGAALLARAAAKLGAPKKDYAANLDPCGPVQEDFEYHLQELGLWLQGDVDGGLTDLCFVALKKNAAKFPQDALMQAVAGVYTGDEGPALALLTSGSYQCPSYVRPVPAYCAIHRAFAAKVVLSRFGG